jgi:CheY-like chemotaxis protein
VERDEDVTRWVVSVYPCSNPMRRIVILSPHRPSRELLSRLLAEPGLSVITLADADEALEAIKRRYPRQPLITLIPGRLRVFDGSEERVRDVRDGTTEGLHVLLSELQRATKDLLAQDLLRLLRPPTGEA